MQSADLQAKIAVWRHRTREGSMTPADYKEAITTIRGERKSAAVASEQSKKKAAKVVIPDAKTMLDSLKGLK